MATFDPKIVISAAPGVTGYLYLVLYEATAPTVPVANSGQLAPPHNASRQLQFIGLNPVIHLAKLFVTNGVSTTGTIIANFSIDPKYPGVEVQVPRFMYADTEPGLDSGTSQFTDPNGVLTGWDYSVDIRGFGLLDPVLEVDTVAPGYRVLITDYEIQPGELHIIKFQPKLITYNPTANTGGNLFSDVELITADQSLVSADTGKQFLIESDTSTIRITLPEIDSVVAKKLFMFTSEGGSHKNAVIEVDGSDNEKIDWGGPQDELILGQNEHAWLFKWIDPDDDTNRRWKVSHASDGILRAGETFMFGRNTDLINSVFANGAELDRDVYPRLWAYVQTLDASQLVSDATWNTGTDSKGKYSTGDGSTTFRVPLLYAYGFMRGVDGTVRKAGSYEAGQNKMHGHSIKTTNSPISGVDTGDAVRGNIVGTANTRGAADDTDAGNKTIGSSGGAEARPDNIGTYLCIRS